MRDAITALRLGTCRNSENGYCLASLGLFRVGNVKAADVNWYTNVVNGVTTFSSLGADQIGDAILKYLRELPELMPEDLLQELDVLVLPNANAEEYSNTAHRHKIRSVFHRLPKTNFFTVKELIKMSRDIVDLHADQVSALTKVSVTVSPKIIRLPGARIKDYLFFMEHLFQHYDSYFESPWFYERFFVKALDRLSAAARIQEYLFNNQADNQAIARFLNDSARWNYDEYGNVNELIIAEAILWKIRAMIGSDHPLLRRDQVIRVFKHFGAFRKFFRMRLFVQSNLLSYTRFSSQPYNHQSRHDLHQKTHLYVSQRFRPMP